MNNQADAEAYPSAGEPMIILSEDGYVRLTLETFLSTPLVHLLSGLDDDNPIVSQGGASLARISGYTEWVSTTTPAITIGWDWELSVLQGHALYVRLGAPRSNAMFVDAMQHDLGSAKSTLLLVTTIDALAWQKEAQKHIVTRYA